MEIQYLHNINSIIIRQSNQISCYCLVIILHIANSPMASLLERNQIYFQCFKTHFLV